MALALGTLIGVADLTGHLPPALPALYVVPLLIGGGDQSWRVILAWLAAFVALTLAASAWNERPLADAFLAVAVALASAGVMGLRSIMADRKSNAPSKAALWALLAETAPAFFWSVDKRGRVHLINGRLEEWTGLKASDLLSLPNWLPLFHPDDRPMLEGFMARDSQGGEAIQSKARLQRARGGYGWLMLTKLRVAPDQTPTPDIDWICSAVDIDHEMRTNEQIQVLNTDLAKAADEATERAELYKKRFRSLFNDLNIACTEQHIIGAKTLLDEAKGDGLADFDDFAAQNPELIARCLASLRCADFSDAFMALTGYADQAALHASPIEDRVVEAQTLKMLQLRCLYEGRRHFTTTVTLLTSDGRRLPVALGANMPDDWSTSFYTHIDITDRQRAHELIIMSREEMARANRVATMGALSASLAHELNQPVVAMSIDVRTCLRYLDADPPQIEDATDTIERVARNVDRVGRIVQRTREQLVRDRSPPAIFDLGDVASEVASIIEPDILRRQTVLRVHRPLGSARVLAHRVEMQQVFVNLILNAADAMAQTAGERRIDVRIMDGPTDFVTVEVEDTGPGISEEVAGHIFAPFFTTKQGGMGLGLQICQSIIEAAGGTIKAVNRLEGGAVFRFVLPSADG